MRFGAAEVCFVPMSGLNSAAVATAALDHLADQPRADLDLVRQRRMHRAAVGDRQQARPLVVRHRALDRDVAGDLANGALLALAIGAVLGVNPVVLEAYGDAPGSDALALGIKPSIAPGSTALTRMRGDSSAAMLRVIWLSAAFAVP